MTMLVVKERKDPPRPRAPYAQVVRAGKPEDVVRPVLMRASLDEECS